MSDANSRRAILAGFAGTLAIPAVATMPMREPSPDPIDAIRHTADLLAGMMAEAYGGDWKVLLDDEAGVLLIWPKGGAR